jgi:hypothetical protein
MHKNTSNPRLAGLDSFFRNTGSPFRKAPQADEPTQAGFSSVILGLFPLNIQP